MDAQDHTTHTTTPSGHESHGVHLCHRCGWPFPNPHPSAKHRRAHKKICGTIEGYTNLIGSEVVSDDEHHSDDDDDKEKTPSPKIEIKGNFSRSEDEFADAVTEFVDSGTTTGSVKKAMDRDIFFSFKDAENDGTNEVLNAAPVEIKKVDTSIEVSEKTNPHVEKTEETEIKTVCDSSESNLELTGTGNLVKDGVVGPAPEPSHVSKSHEAKGQESQTSETITEEAKDSEITKTTPEVSAIVGGSHDSVDQENFEKLESMTTNGTSEDKNKEANLDCEHVSEVVKESGTVEEIKIAPEVVKEPETDEKIESDHKHVQEVAKESETDQNVSVGNEKVDLCVPNEQIQEVVKEPVEDLTQKKDLDAPELKKSSGEQIQEDVKEPVAVLIEKEDLGGPQLEKQSIEHTHEVVEKSDSVITEKEPELEGISKEQIQEAVNEPDTVSTEKEDLGGPHLEKQSIEHAHEVVEKPDSVMTEKDLGSSKEQIQETVKEPDTVLTEKEDLGGPHLEKQSNEHAHEVVEKPDPILTTNQDLDAPELKKCTQENIVEEPDSLLTEKEDLGAHKSETCSNGEIIEQKVDKDRDLVADVSAETVTLKDTSGSSVTNDKDTSVSVLPTTSIDAEPSQPTEKSKVNSEKSNTAPSDDFEPPSFMTLVEPETKDTKSSPSELQDPHQQPNPEPSQAGWFPTLTEVNNESEGRKRNEEAISKVTNLTTGKQSTPLKNLLGEARSPSGKQLEPVVQKEEPAVNPVVNPAVNDDVSSPPKLIEDEKKGRKKAKGISSWVPFGCCSSVNAVK